MTRRQVALAGGVVGLIMPAIVLTLLSLFGVLSIVPVGNTDLTRILWPFSIMLTTAWHRTAGGLLITIAAVAFNFVTYMVIALLLQALLRLMPRRRSD